MRANLKILKPGHIAAIMPASFPPTIIDQHSPKICLKLYCSALAIAPKGTTTIEGIGSIAQTRYNTVP
jgi:hypothetical protein